MTSISDLEKEILLIKTRNKKVEIDKAWETSERSGKNTFINKNPFDMAKNVSYDILIKVNSGW